MFTLNPLKLDELPCLAEIDVSEEVTRSYRLVDGKLESFARDSTRPRWNAQEWAQHIVEWQTTLLPDVWLGAWDGERLMGAASLRYRLPGMQNVQMAQLTTLHVDRAYRRHGVGKLLLAEVIRLAMAHGAMELYVSASESESAVGFYLKQGFRPTDTPHPQLFALEPEDIHMIRRLLTS